MRTVVAETADQPDVLVPIDAVAELIGATSTSEEQIMAFGDRLKVKVYSPWDERWAVSVKDAARVAKAVREENARHQEHWSDFLADQRARREAAHAREVARRQVAQEDLRRRQKALNDRQRAEAAAKLVAEAAAARKTRGVEEALDFATFVKTKEKAR